MTYDAQTIHSPSQLKRWSHASRFRLACDLIDPRAGDRILDYGAGDATLLAQLHQRAPGATFVGFEPCMTAEAAANAPPGVRIVGSADGLRGFDKVACLEVLEHLEGAALREAIENILAATRPGGTILVSVPIEIGPSAIAKNLARAAVGACHENTTVMNTLRSAFGRTGRITRRAVNGFIDSHMGFDWRALRETLLRGGLQEERVLFSPVASLGPVLNSQVTMVFRR